MRAALRELHEETGIQSARIVASVRACCNWWLAHRAPLAGAVHSLEPPLPQAPLLLPRAAAMPGLAGGQMIVFPRLVCCCRLTTGWSIRSPLACGSRAASSSTAARRRWSAGCSAAAMYPLLLVASVGGAAHSDASGARNAHACSLVGVPPAVRLAPAALPPLPPLPPRRSARLPLVPRRLLPG